MALVEEQLTRFFQVLNTSKIISELDELQSLGDAHFTTVQTGLMDAKKVSIPLIRGKLGDYNASTQTPLIGNSTSIEGDSYFVSVGGTVDFGNGNVVLEEGDIIEHISGQWRKTNETSKSKIEFHTDWENDKPVIGKENTLYADVTNFKLYIWNGAVYKAFFEDAFNSKLSRSTYSGTAVDLINEAKGYTDSMIDGAKWKNEAVCATTTNITLSGEQIIDGIQTAASRVLVKNQTDPKQNGIYLTSATAWTRTTDANENGELVAATLIAAQGTINAEKIFYCTSDTAIIGTDNIDWITRGNAVRHNSTTGLQGGFPTNDEYFHLSEAEKNRVETLPSGAIETVTGAQQKADNAETAAIDYVDAKAATTLEAAKDYADALLVAGNNHVHDSYATMATMIADQANQLDGEYFVVVDASAHSTVEAGWAFFEYLGTTTGTEADYRKLSEQESMDLVHSGEISVQDENGVEQFKISDFVRFDNVTFDPVTKTITPIDTIGGGTSGGQVVYNVKNLGVKGDGIDLVDGNITSGTNVFTSGVAPFKSSDVGKTIAIHGAITGGGFLVTTIAGFTDANTVTLATNASVTVSSVGWYFGTDDTVAIQNVIQQVFDDGGGVVYFPKSIYIIAGALQTSVGAYNLNPNSQLWIPYDNTEFFDLRNRPTIEIRGEFASVLDQGSVLVDRVASNRGSILRSSIQGSGSEPSVIANKGGAPNDNTNKSRTNLFVKNMNIQLTPNANSKLTMGGINAKHSSIANFEFVTVYPYYLNMQEIGEPNVVDVTGISLPNVNCEHICSIRNAHVGGLTNGYQYGEHSSLYDANALACINGFLGTENHHTANLVRVSAHWCKYDITINSTVARHYVHIEHLQAEWRSGGDWFDSVACLNDPGNKAVGHIKFDIVEASVGLNNEKFKKIGGEKFSCSPISVDPFNSNTATSYTLKLTDAKRFIDCYHGISDQTIIVPNSSSVTFDKNARIVINRNGPARVILQGATGVDLQFPTGFLAEISQQYDGVELVYRGNNKWALFGALKPQQ